MSVTHFICPGCGAEVRVGSKGCPKCTRIPEPRQKAAPKPWEQDTAHDGLNLDLPEDDDFDYESFIADEFGGLPPKRSRREWLWWVTAVILLAALVYYFVL